MTCMSYVIESTCSTILTIHQIVWRLRGQKHHNCSFCDKRTIFTGSSPFNITIHIRYGGISEITLTAENLKFLSFHYTTLMWAKLVEFQIHYLQKGVISSKSLQKTIYKLIKRLC